MRDVEAVHEGKGSRALCRRRKERLNADERRRSRKRGISASWGRRGEVLARGHCRHRAFILILGDASAQGPFRGFPDQVGVSQLQTDLMRAPMLTGQAGYLSVAARGYRLYSAWLLGFDASAWRYGGLLRDFVSGI